MNDYVKLFSSLHTAKIAGINAPHKAILLLTIMEMIESGEISSPRIILTERFEQMFNTIWSRYIGTSLVFQPKVATPFWHMQNEPFYRLCLNDGGDLNGIKNPYSISRLREKTYALIDRELFEAMQDQNERAELRIVLISTYLKGLHPRVDKALSILGLLGFIAQIAA